jgi:hypothetical protein
MPRARRRVSTVTKAPAPHGDTWLRYFVSFYTDDPSDLDLDAPGERELLVAPDVYRDADLFRAWLRRYHPEMSDRALDGHVFQAQRRVEERSRNTRP